METAAKQHPWGWFATRWVLKAKCDLAVHWHRDWPATRPYSSSVRCALCTASAEFLEYCGGRPHWNSVNKNSWPHSHWIDRNCGSHWRLNHWIVVHIPKVLRSSPGPPCEGWAFHTPCTRPWWLLSFLNYAKQQRRASCLNRFFARIARETSECHMPTVKLEIVTVFSMNRNSHEIRGGWVTFGYSAHISGVYTSTENCAAKS